MYQIKEQEFKNSESKPRPRVCIYCEKSEHKASDCESVSSIKKTLFQLYWKPTEGIRMP